MKKRKNPFNKEVFLFVFFFFLAEKFLPLTIILRELIVGPKNNVWLETTQKVFVTVDYCRSIRDITLMLFFVLLQRHILLDSVFVLPLPPHKNQYNTKGNMVFFFSFRHYTEDLLESLNN